MRPKSEALLWDVVDAVRFIVEVSSEGSLSRYLEDRLFRQGIERNFEIIGEALNALARDDLALAEKIPGYRQLIGLRNRLAHGYRDIDDRLMWKYINDLLPPFLAEIEALLN